MYKSLNFITSSLRLRSSLQCEKKKSKKLSREDSPTYVKFPHCEQESSFT